VADRQVDFLLIGGGLAAANCARWLREEGADGSILLVGREPDPPYNRPPCSKGFLRGEESREDTYFRPNEWWEEQSIDLLTRVSVMGLDLDARTVKLSNREEVGFDRALLATGANVRILHVDGARLEGLHYLRTLGTAEAIRADAEGSAARSSCRSRSPTSAPSAARPARTSSPCSRTTAWRSTATTSWSASRATPTA
jgi:3-phenylpropionate/trans-cinnamate dioxygenase ferredoxin reductase subunit